MAKRTAKDVIRPTKEDLDRAEEAFELARQRPTALDLAEGAFAVVAEMCSRFRAPWDIRPVIWPVRHTTDSLNHTTMHFAYNRDLLFGECPTEKRIAFEEALTAELNRHQIEARFSPAVSTS